VQGVVGAGGSVMPRMTSTTVSRARPPIRAARTPR
jgi:hypothetical protein